MLKIARGEPTSIPNPLAIHLVAAAYGQSPAQVREWPADDFTLARAVLEAVRT